MPEPELETMVGELAAAGFLEPATPFDDGARMARQLLYLRDRAPAGADAAAMQRRLAAAHVVVLGCGGLGSWSAAALACIGVGRLTIVDSDVVELSNLNRQLLFRESDVGRPKVVAAAGALRAFSTDLRVQAVARELTGVDDVREVVSGASLVLCLADRPPYAIARWVGAACHAEGVAHLSAGQLPPVVRVGPLVVPGETACSACLECQLRDENPLYDRLEALRTADERPLAALGPASGVVGCVIATEALHRLTGLATPATLGSVWTLDLRTLAGAMTPVARREDCAVCGVA